MAQRLLDQGVSVKTLTRNPGREDPFGGRVSAVPLDFSDQGGLRRSMEGTNVLYNTYWIRFGRGLSTFDRAVEKLQGVVRRCGQCGRRQDRPLLGGQRLNRVQAALLSGAKGRWRRF